MHDTINNIAPNAFPYTTWDEIPNIENADGRGVYKATNSTSGFDQIYLYIPNYIIGFKNTNIG